MELTCPIQCTYHLTEVTGRKDLAQQSKQKTLKGLPGTFSAKLWRINIASQLKPSFPAKTDITAKCTQVDQR